MSVRIGKVKYKNGLTVYRPSFGDQEFRDWVSQFTNLDRDKEFKGMLAVKVMTDRIETRWFNNGMNYMDMIASAELLKKDVYEEMSDE